MRYARITGGLVVNTAQIEPSNLTGWTEIPDGVPVTIDWRYEDGEFLPPIVNAAQIARNATLVASQTQYRYDRLARAADMAGDKAGSLENQLKAKGII